MHGIQTSEAHIISIVYFSTFKFFEIAVPNKLYNQSSHYVLITSVHSTRSTYFSMLEKVYTLPAFVSTSKSKDLVLPALRAKFTAANSSKRMCTGGLCTKMKPRSRGYSKPVAALYEQLIAGVPE